MLWRGQPCKAVQEQHSGQRGEPSAKDPRWRCGWCVLKARVTRTQGLSGERRLEVQAELVYRDLFDP